MIIDGLTSLPFFSEYRLNYTFSFPEKRGSKFTCVRSRSCPVIPDPPQCPPGYTEVRANRKCGLYCRDIVGYTWRCPCRDWMSCAVKERYLWGCAAFYYSSFRVRECTQGLFVKEGLSKFVTQPIVENRAVARALIGGGVYIHIFRSCPTSFF